MERKSYNPNHTDEYARQLRNSEDYDDWDYGTEPIPHDHTWHSKQLDVSPGEAE